VRPSTIARVTSENDQLKRDWDSACPKPAAAVAAQLVLFT